MRRIHTIARALLGATIATGSLIARGASHHHPLSCRENALRRRERAPGIITPIEMIGPAIVTNVPLLGRGFSGSPRSA